MMFYSEVLLSHIIVGIIIVFMETLFKETPDGILPMLITSTDEFWVLCSNYTPT